MARRRIIHGVKYTPLKNPVGDMDKLIKLMQHKDVSNFLESEKAYDDGEEQITIRLQIPKGVTLE